jgi:hypothetical protein
VDDPILCRFIIEELFQHEMDGICIPGMTFHFIYEEFHPKSRLDIKRVIDYFFPDLYAKSSNTYAFTGNGCFKLSPIEYGGWEMYFIDLPGLKIE